jgi:hypothetical protein
MPLIRSAGALPRAARIARVKTGCDIVHAQYGALVGALGSFQKSGAFIVSLRGSDIYWRFGKTRNRLGGLARMFLSWIACLRSRAVIVMSHEMAQRIRRWPGLRKRAVYVISDPAGAIFWPPEVRDISERLYGEAFLVVTASIQADNPVKRNWIVADAAELCGAAGMALEIHAISGQTREAVHDAFSRADCVALASTHEGWPNVVKEALLLGRNFVTTDVGDLARFATVTSGNHIVGPNALQFACAWVDQLAARVLRPHGIGSELAPFHPDVVALKHRLLYLACARNIT